MMQKSNVGSFDSFRRQRGKGVQMQKAF